MFTDWLIEYGLWSLAFLMLLQNLIPVLPSEVIMPLAGFLASLGYMDVRGAILAGLAGSMLGHVPWYLLGRTAGEHRLRRLADRHGRWLGLGEQHVRKADHWFQRHASGAVFLGRLVPGIRTCVNIPAGATRMPLWPFLGYTLLGDAIWTASLAWGGFTLGRDYRLVSWYLHVLLLPVILFAGLAAYWLVRRRPGRRAKGPSDRSRKSRRPFRAGQVFRRLPWRFRFPGIPKEV